LPLRNYVEPIKDPCKPRKFPKQATTSL